MDLVYNIAVIGQDRLRRSLRSVERELNSHAKRIEQTTGTRVSGGQRTATAARRSTSSFAETKKLFRPWEEVGKVAARLEMKRHRDALRNIEKEKNAKIRAEEAAARAAKRAQAAAITAQRRHRQGVGRNASASIMSAGGGVMRTGASMAGLASGAVMFNAARQEMSAEGAAADLAGIHFGAMPTDKRSRGRIKEDVLGLASGISRKSGISRAEIIGGLSKFQEKSADLQQAERLMPFMAELKDSKGGRLEDYGEFAGLAAQAMRDSGIKDPDKVDAGVKRALSGAAAMAARGQISMTDMAQLGGQVAATAGRQGGDPVRNILDAMATMNIAIRGGASSPAEAATSAIRMTDDLIKNQDKFRKAGVEVFDERGDVRAMDQIVLESLKATKGSLPALKDLFDVRGMRAIETQAKMFREASGGKTDDESIAKGVARVKAEQQRFFSADVSDAERKQGAAFRRSQADRKVDKTIAEFNQALGKQLLPVLTKAIPELKTAIPTIVKATSALADFAKFFLDNPLKGIGLIIAGQVALDVAKAGIGRVIAAGITRSMATGGVISAAGRGVAGMNALAPAPLGGGAGAGAAVVGAGAAAAIGVALAGDQLSKLNKDLGVDAPSMNPLAGKDGEVTMDSILGNVVNPFGKDSFGARVGANIGGAAKGLMSFKTAKVNSTEDYDEFTREAREAKNAQQAKAVEGSDKLGKSTEAAAKAADGASKAFDGLTKKIEGLKLPDPGRSGDPISKGS